MSILLLLLGLFELIFGLLDSFVGIFFGLVVLFTVAL